MSSSWMTGRQMLMTTVSTGEVYLVKIPSRQSRLDTMQRAQIRRDSIALAQTQAAEVCGEDVVKFNQIVAAITARIDADLERMFR